MTRWGEIKCPRCAELEAQITAMEEGLTAVHMAGYMDGKRAAEAKLAKAVGLLEAWINVATHCTIEEGVCCCGDNMDTHAEPINCGHSPVDHGAYIAEGLVEETNATIAAITETKPPAPDWRTRSTKTEDGYNG